MCFSTVLRHHPIRISAEVVEVVDRVVDRARLLQLEVLLVEGQSRLRVLDRVVLVGHAVGHLLAEEVPREEAEREAARAGDPEVVDRVDHLRGGAERRG